MDNAMWLAGIFGPFMVILGLWRLIFADNFNKAVNSIKASPGLMYSGAFISLLIGLVIVKMYNMWGWNLNVLVTLLGWVMIIQGVLDFFMPRAAMKLLNNKQFTKAWTVIGLIWGLILCWLAWGSTAAQITHKM